VRFDANDAACNPPEPACRVDDRPAGGLVLRSLIFGVLVAVIGY
jgi:hypothetical protein